VVLQGKLHDAIIYSLVAGDLDDWQESGRSDQDQQPVREWVNPYSEAKAMS